VFLVTEGYLDKRGILVAASEYFEFLGDFLDPGHVAVLFGERQAAVKDQRGAVQQGVHD
jgi:hypothetical protein